MPARMWRHGIHSCSGSLHQSWGGSASTSSIASASATEIFGRVSAWGTFEPGRPVGRKIGEHLFTTYLSIARGRFGQHHVLVLGPHPGIDGMGGLFWSILHNANVFLHHVLVQLGPLHPSIVC